MSLEAKKLYNKSLLFGEVINEEILEEFVSCKEIKLSIKSKEQIVSFFNTLQDIANQCKLSS